MARENRKAAADWPGVGATLVLAAVWGGVLLAAEFGGDDQTPWRWGLIPAYFSATALLTYPLLHAGWGHLLANLLPLLLLAPPLEERWGPVFFAGFAVLAGVAAGGAYGLLTPGSEAPLIGANGVASALMGACLVRFWSTPVRFFQLLWGLKLVEVDAWAPIWVMLPIWIFTRLLLAAFSDGGAVVGGAAQWCDAGGFAFGIVAAGAMRWAEVEGRFIDPELEPETRSSARSLLDRAHELRATGQGDAAYALLSDSVRRGSADAQVVAAFWEVAGECNELPQAASRLIVLAGERLSQGDEAGAVRLWGEVFERVPNAEAPRRLILRLLPALVARDAHELAISTLRRAFDPALGELRAAQALQLLEVARSLDPPAALQAARCVLASNELPLEKRERLEALAAELETRCAEKPAFDPAATASTVEDTTAGRAIELEPDDFVPPSQSRAVAEPAPPSVRELDATGSLVASDSNGELVPSDVPVDRWAAPSAAAKAPDDSAQRIAAASADSVARFFGVKVIEVTPERIGEEGLVLRRSTGASGLVPYAKIQALAVGAVGGLADKSVLVIDLVMNWNDASAEQLQVLRLRSDRFDPRGLVKSAGGTVDALRALLEQLLARTGAVPLPELAAVRGRPFSTHADLRDYERSVLHVTA